MFDICLDTTTTPSKNGHKYNFDPQSVVITKMCPGSFSRHLVCRANLLMSRRKSLLLHKLYLLHQRPTKVQRFNQFHTKQLQ